MGYRMETFLYGQTRYLDNPSWQEVETALKTLWDYRLAEPEDDYAFVILSAEPAVHNCQYVQTAQNYGEAEMSLEARFQHKGHFKHYHLDTDFKQVSKAFSAFLKGKRIFTLGWQDWTDQMR